MLLSQSPSEPSQSRKPGRQLNVHAELAHRGAALAGGVQTWPHEPQLFASFEKLASHPSADKPSQLPKPAVHVMEHVVPEHTGVESGPLGQTLRHAPQLFRLLVTLVSHPSDTMPSQS